MAESRARGLGGGLRCDAGDGGVRDEGTPRLRKGSVHSPFGEFKTSPFGPLSKGPWFWRGGV